MKDKIKVGIAEDWFGQAGRKYQIIAETTDGRYVCKHCPIQMKSIANNPYLAEPLTSLFLKKKSEISDIREEEING